MQLEDLQAKALRCACACAWWNVRTVREETELLSVRAGVVEPPRLIDDIGTMVTVVDGGGIGHAATSDLSDSGLRQAFLQARDLAQAMARLPTFFAEPLTSAQSHWQTPLVQPWQALPRPQRLQLLLQWDAAIRLAGPQIVDSQVAITATTQQTWLVTSAGGAVWQRQDILHPALVATASDGVHTQRRSFQDSIAQGDWQFLQSYELLTQAQRIGREAVRLLTAPICPQGRTTLLLAADQMMLQIHESIGHPLELDRILGDERNFAGTSFVTADMFGTYAYGSPLLNVTFDPGVDNAAVAAAVDDDGARAERQYIIKDGILQRPLGGELSQRRANMAGVATTRACSWNRPPIDRMSNLNLEAGDKSEAELVASTENGILLRTNLSWSIDDSRNKFQFGCEWGEVIRDGRVTGIVRGGNYRGISATFWRSLSGVGCKRGIHGTPTCGKGEPLQIVRVGHVTPMCRFDNVDVFA